MTRIPSMARIAVALAIGLAIPLAPACSGDPLEPGPAEPAIPEPPQPPNPPADSIIVPPRSAAAEAEVVGKSNVFAWDLLAATIAGDPEENVLVSPLSASMALGMALNGARGATYEQMQATLGFADVALDTINNGYRGLMADLPVADSTVNTQIANSAWHRSDFEVEPTFANTVRAFFDAEVAGLDFSDASAAGTMNQWVADRTNGRIEKIIEPPIDSRTVLFLINAVYFKGPWKYAFDPAKTRDAPFHIAEGESESIPMMDQTREFPHGRDGSLQIVDLPFGEGTFAMTILVPGGENSVDDEIASMDEGRWESILEKLTTRRVQVMLPRFRVEYDKSLKEILRSLGMTDPFMPNVADFTGISATPPPLYISEVKQKTYIEVSEEGAEAAGTTSVGIGVTSLPPLVVADRPFAYVIRERGSGAILFAGVLRRPPEAE